MSAVSGGSYIASSFATVASWSAPELLGEGTPPVYAPGSPEEQHLRNNSSYLAPGGGGKLRLVLRFLLGLVANLALVGLALFIIAVPIALGYELLYSQLEAPGGKGMLDVPLELWLILGIAGVLGIVLAVPDLVRRMKNDRWRVRLEVWSYRLLATTAFVFFMLIAVPQLILWSREISDLRLIDLGSGLFGAQSGAAEKGQEALTTIGLASVCTALLGALRALVARRPTVFAIAAGAIAGPLAVLVAFLWFVNGAVDNGVSGENGPFGGRRSLAPRSCG